MKKMVLRLLMCVVIAVSALSAGCGAAGGEDLYTLDHIDGSITCEYRTGKNASYADECVDTDVVFDKDKFIELFHEYGQYDPVRLSKNPKECDLMINAKDQPEEWDAISSSEFNIRAVYDGGQRDVSVYWYGGKLYFYVLNMGGNKRPDLEGAYFMELSEGMSSYWGAVIDAVVR